MASTNERIDYIYLRVSIDMCFDCAIPEWACVDTTHRELTSVYIFYVAISLVFIVGAVHVCGLWMCGVVTLRCESSNTIV